MNAPVSTPPSPSLSSDELLVARLRSGDAAAGETLVDRHCEALLRYLQKLTRSRHAAEELHQQTWTSVLDHLDRFNASVSGGFKAWLFRIATNKVNDYWRSRGREIVVMEGLRLVRDTESVDPSARIDMDEQVGQLKQAIEQLPVNQKQVVMMRYYGDMKFVEIAQALGCPLNTALGRMHKAMLRLKQAMSRP